jgi:hypothetical protein
MKEKRFAQLFFFVSFDVFVDEVTRATFEEHDCVFFTQAAQQLTKSGQTNCQ